MKRLLIGTLAFGMLGLFSQAPAVAVPLGNEITYQGLLNDGADVANGVYDVQFRLFDAATGGVQIGGVNTFSDIPIVDGLLTVDLNFGSTAFTKDARWIEVRIRDGASAGAYTTLTPRQPVKAAPVALQSLKDANWSISGSNISNSNTGNVGINESLPIAQLHVVGTSDLGAQFSSADLSTEQVVIEGGQAWLGLYSDNVGAPGSGLTLGEVDTSTGAMTKWSLVQRTSGNGGDLSITYGSDPTPNLNARYMEIDPDGDVGFSTSPAARMHVYYEDQSFDTPRVLRLESYQNPGSFEFHSALDFSGTDIDGRNLDNNTGGSVHINRQTNGDISMVRGGGAVGIGTQPFTGAHLEVENTSITGFSSANVQFDDVIIEDEANAFLGLYSDDQGNVGSGIVFGEIGTGANPDHKWAMYTRTTDNVGDLVITYGTDVNPTANEKMFQVHRDGTTQVKVLEILGADVAERFPCSDAAAEAGDVLMIDANNPGQLCLSSGAYNTKVAGVVSGAGDIPVGAILGNMPGNEDSPAVALSGRVWVKCDASTNAIEVGDLITTAEKTGHAMKAVDRTMAGGATIGKAMTSLPQGEIGLVLVLVNLQ
ncbi:MAG: hypothetical protein AB7N71_07370 [Phycisphaerae bacterium]